MTRIRLIVALATATVALLSATGIARAAIVTNGDFETGNFSGWHEDYAQDPGPGFWFVYTGTTSPINGDPFPAPPQGTHAALTDETNVSRQILYQDVTVPGGISSAELSLITYYTAYTQIVSPETLDTGPGTNEQYRIDIMRPGAPVASVAPGDVLLNAFRTNTGDPIQLAPTVKAVDLSQYAGQTIRLRFAVVTTEDVLNAGIDAVGIHTLRVDKPKSNSRKGSATIPVTVSDPGTVTVSGKGVKAHEAGASKPIVVSGGTSKLLIKPKGKTKRKLNESGKAKVKLTITYTPTNAAAFSVERKVKLKQS
jgi:hypothetical protein